MKSMKKIVSLCLILCICISCVQVSADNSYIEQSMEIESVSGTEIYKVLSVNNCTYMAASDYGKITRYEYKEGLDNVLYTLGDKLVSVSKKEGNLSLPMQNYSTKFSKTVSYNGNTYIAMDELLPWLNVTCSVENSKLIVTSDAISIWELTDVLINDYETYKFNLYKDMGETEASSVGLAAAMMFDTIVNVRFDKLIPIGDSIFDPDGSLYDRNCYRDLFIEMATDQSLLSAQADGVLEKVFKINKNIGTIEKAFGVDADKIRLYGDSYLAEFGISEEVSNKFDFLTNDWLEARKIIKDFSDHNPFKIMKSFETTVYTTNEYRNYLATLCDEKDVDSVMKSGIMEASIRLTESKGAIYSYLIDLGYNKISEKITKSIKDDISTTFKNTSWGSIFLYLDLAKIFYSTVVPVTDGISEMSKFIIYSNVSDYSWDKAYEYAGKELTQDNIAFMCQSYMASLKSSKKALEGMQKVFDSKAFGFSIFEKSEGLMNYRIEPINEMLAKLALTSFCRENDSTENKDKKAEEIRQLLSSISLEESGNEESADEFNIEQHMGLWWFELLLVDDGSIEGLDITKLGKNEAEVLFFDMLTKINFVSDNVAVTDRYGPNNEYQDVYTFTTNKYGKSMLEVNTVYADTGKISEKFIKAYRNQEDFSVDNLAKSKITLEEAQQIAINTSGYKYATYINEDGDKFYFYLTNNKKYSDSIKDELQRNGRVPNGIEKVIYSVLKTSGKCVEEFSNASPSTDSKLSEAEAQAKLETWLGDLGTWVAGEDNVLVCDGTYNCNGKEYYQFRLSGWVYDHYTTLTWYVISVDGTEIFEGQCLNGNLNRF